MRQNELFPPNCFLFENLFEGRVLLVETPQSRDLGGCGGGIPPFTHEGDPASETIESAQFKEQ